MTAGRRAARGFSLIDLLVSMGVIAVLMAMLLPAMTPVRETAKRLVCRSGVRQIGMGIAMYAEERNDRLPPSVFVATNSPKPVETVHLRVEWPTTTFWDGLGHLYEDQYLRTPGIFYCPSHFGEFRLSDNAWKWQIEGRSIVGNYQYRGTGPQTHQKHLSEIEPKASAIVSDSLRHVSEYSHRVGANVLRADLSVFWFHDTGLVSSNLGSGPGETGMTLSNSLASFWHLFDTAR